MISRLTVFLALAAVAGCASAGCNASSAPGPKAKEERDVVGWRLVDKPYGEIDDPWVSPGDGIIPPGEIAMLYEPVYRDEKTLVRNLVTARSACDHVARASYDGPPSVNAGDPVTVTVWIDGPRDTAHIVEFEGTNPHVEIREIAGAAPLSGEPGRYLLEPGARASVTFTSRAAGPGGIRVSVASEVIYVGRGSPRPLK